jgi:hypothetical protein
LAKRLALCGRRRVGGLRDTREQHQAKAEDETQGPSDLRGGRWA